MDEMKRIAERWNALGSDKKRWEYLLSHRDEVGLLLDNDRTVPFIHCDKIPNGFDYEELPKLVRFDECIGWSEGILVLMEILGIQAEAA